MHMYYDVVILYCCAPEFMSKGFSLTTRPNYRTINYDSIFNLSSGVTCNWCIQLDAPQIITLNPCANRQHHTCLCADKNINHVLCFWVTNAHPAKSLILSPIYQNVYFLFSQHLIPSFHIVEHEIVCLLGIIKYYILDPFYSGAMTSNIPSILKSTYYHSNPGRGSIELSA